MDVKSHPPGFQYTYEIDAVKRDDEGKARRAFTCHADPTTLPDGVNSLTEAIVRCARLYGDKPYLGHRKMVDGKPGGYVWLTYDQVLNRVKHLGSGLVHLGCSPGDRIGLFSINRPEWLISDFGSSWAGLVDVPLYDTLGDEAIEYIVNKCEMQIVIASNDKAALLLKLASKMPTLKKVVLMDGTWPEIIEAGKASGIEMLELTAIEKSGEAKTLPAHPTLPDDVITISFTSGTTSLPKGAMLTSRNLLSFTEGCIQMFAKNMTSAVHGQDTYLSFLPLAHIMERTLLQLFSYFGGAIGFYHGDVTKVVEDIQELKPTLFCAVPRLWNRLYDKINAGVQQSSWVKRKIFKIAYKSKLRWLRKGFVHHSFWDKIVFKSIREKLGGRMRFLMSGAAPISPDILDFLRYLIPTNPRICFSAVVAEGYGATETSGGISMTNYQDKESGHVGPPLPNVIIKLRDLPTMNYQHTDLPYPRGEICIKGGCIFKGYYKDPEKTEELLDEDGWYYTGDVGYWDEAGRLRIIDRAKNIFKLSQGEYVAPEKIEAVYTKLDIVSQTFVYGDSLKPTLVGIIIPEEEPFRQWATKYGFGINTPFEELARDPKLKAALLKCLQDQGKSLGLKGFENVQAIYIDTNPFTVANGLLTPTFKLKRFEAKNKYYKELERAYDDLK
ncbi:Long chain acyl-CoA synthetase 7 peroxisomal [Kappamyces sp. JEL0829]|nr:Long chain acyl-CoA synthetase 7 peroxisomal [Kappamyces sp. JEL0829]